MGGGEGKERDESKWGRGREGEGQGGMRVNGRGGVIGRDKAHVSMRER